MSVFNWKIVLRSCVHDNLPVKIDANVNFCSLPQIMNYLPDYLVFDIKRNWKLNATVWFVIYSKHLSWGDSLYLVWTHIYTFMNRLDVFVFICSKYVSSVFGIVLNVKRLGPSLPSNNLSLNLGSKKLLGSLGSQVCRVLVIFFHHVVYSCRKELICKQTSK